jgi:bifunctional enzyme CysN/CysC
MATAASNCDLAVVLVDAREGIVEQTRRHSFIAVLLGIKHLVIAVNKMDLVDRREDRFDAIRRDYDAFAARLEVTDVEFIPMVASTGENVVARSPLIDWYGGRPLLDHLENVHIASDRNLIDCRFPVQYVIRPRDDNHHDYRGYAGQVASGTYKLGDDIIVLPSGFTSRIASIDTADGPIDEAVPPMSITIRLTDDLDISRGDMICRPNNQPHIGQDIDAMLCWFNERTQLQPGNKYALKHTTKWARAMIKELQYRLDVNTLHRDDTASTLALNEIGRVTLRTTQPLFYDDYRRNRATGSFILIDETTNDTLAAAMIV